MSPEPTGNPEASGVSSPSETPSGTPGTRAEDQPRNGLTEFADVVKDFRSVGAYAVTGGVAAPLASLLLKISPPWPDATAVSVVTSITELLTLIFLFQFARRWSRARLERWMIGAAVLVLGFALLYFVSWSLLTEKKGSTPDRVVVGLQVRPEVQSEIAEIRRTDDPGFNDRSALRSHEYDVYAIYVLWTIIAAQLLLLLSWLAMFVSLATIIAAFVLTQRQRRIE